MTQILKDTKIDEAELVVSEAIEESFEVLLIQTEYRLQFADIKLQQYYSTFVHFIATKRTLVSWTLCLLSKCPRASGEALPSSFV